RLDQRLGFPELLGKPDHLFGGQEQESILPEERPSPRLQNGAEKVFLSGQLLDQDRRRLGCQFRRRTSMIARMVSSFRGNDFSNATSRWRHGSSLEMSL